jgi:hypothetical protein
MVEELEGMKITDADVGQNLSLVVTSEGLVY